MHWRHPSPHSMILIAQVAQPGSMVHSHYCIHSFLRIPTYEVLHHDKQMPCTGIAHAYGPRHCLCMPASRVVEPLLYNKASTVLLQVL